MNATYTVLMPVNRRRRFFGPRPVARASWLAAIGTFAISLPLALAVTFYLVAGDDEGEQELALSIPVNEMSLPSLPPAPAPGVVAMAPAEEAAAAQVEQVTEITEEDPSQRVVRLEWGGTLIGLLLSAAVPPAEAHEALAALRKVYDPRDVQAGEEVTLRYDTAGSFAGFEFDPAADRIVRVERQDGEFKAASVIRPLSQNVMAAAINIEGSLYESGIKAGVPASAMAELVRVMSYSVDFQRDIKAGDSFRIMYEVMRNPEGQLVRTGQILFAEVNLQGRSVPVYRYRYADGTIDYFDRDGRSVRKALLRTPVNASRMSSGFGMRRHPVLGYTRMHKGVDFAAPTGTPIYAAGDGVVVERGRKGAYGNYIRIRHNGTLQTAYAHMSRFNSSVVRGTRVRQGQVIGYVGSTGRSTGPHLHYEVMVNGVQVNPTRVANMNTGEALRGGNLERLRGIVQAIDTQFQTVQPGLAVEAAFNAVTGEALPQPVSAPTTSALPADAEAKRRGN